MINKADILKMAKHVTKRVAGGRDHEIMHPYRDWSIGIIASTIIIVIGGMWGVDRYLSYQNINIELGADSEGEVVYREAQVKTALSIYERRASDFDTLVAEIPVGVVEESEESMEAATSSSGVNVKDVVDDESLEEDAEDVGEEGVDTEGDVDDFDSGAVEGE